MSIEYKAAIYYGFELYENWGQIVDEEFFDTYSEYFIDPDVCGKCDGPVLFAVEVEMVCEGSYIEINMEQPYIAVEDRQILNEFCTKYQDAIIWHTPNYYLMCRN